VIVSSGVKVRIRLLLAGLPCGSLRDFFLVVHDQKKTVPQDSTLTPTLKRCSHRPPTELTSHGHPSVDASSWMRITVQCTPADAWLSSPIRPLPGEPSSGDGWQCCKAQQDYSGYKPFSEHALGLNIAGVRSTPPLPIGNGNVLLPSAWLRASLPSAAGLGRGGPAIDVKRAYGGSAFRAGPPLHARASARHSVINTSPLRLWTLVTRRWALLGRFRGPCLLVGRSRGPCGPEKRATAHRSVIDGSPPC